MNTLLTSPTSRPSMQSAPSSAELALSLLGPSTSMALLWGQIRRLAPYARTVLLTGPEASGQDAVARLLLELSSAPSRHFVCLSASDAEDHLIRASTQSGATCDSFLYLPEVDRLSPGAQGALLRLLRLRRARNFTVVASTAEDLRTNVGLGTFSSELVDALGAVRIAVPSLSERAEDLPMLLNQKFAVKCQARSRAIPSLSDELLRTAMQHSWPGNLRELDFVVDHLLANSTNQELTPIHLQRALGAAATPPASVPQVRMVKLDAVIQEHIYSVLRACRGNKLRAAEVLGISRSTLYRMLDAPAGSGALPLAS